ncbi:MAG: hypothetical protein ACPHRO_02670 [Nannocystaceae bacterium]
MQQTIIDRGLEANEIGDVETECSFPASAEMLGPETSVASRRGLVVHWMPDVCKLGFGLLR